MKTKNPSFRAVKTKKGSTEYEGMENFEETKRVQEKWFEQLNEDIKTDKTVTEQVLIELKEEARKYYENEVSNYSIKTSKSNSNYRWIKTIMSKGTVSDKVAAFTVSVQDNPIYSLDALRNLVSMVNVAKKKECIAVIDSLTELFLTDLLVPHRKLKPFYQQPLGALTDITGGDTGIRKKYLSIWYFEDQLKETYTSYVLALNKVGHDTVDSNKEKAISAMYKLLAGNSEQEKNLLSYIVNKLGDPSQKVASKAVYCLTQLLHQHLNMQAVVLGEVEKLLFRANISSRAQYYGLCFLSQFYLSHEASEIARKLIEVYFSFFKACVKKGEVDSRMMSALLMGVNRAYPYAKLELNKISEHIDTIYKVVHLASFNVSLHALGLLYQVSDYANSVNDRFYSALYKKLFDPKVNNTTHQAMLLNLVYKALLRDTESDRVKIFIKRLLQVALYSTPCFSCGILYLVSQLIGKKTQLQAITLKCTTITNDDADDDEEEKYVDAKEEDGVEQTEDAVEDKEYLLSTQNLTDELKTDIVNNTDILENKSDVTNARPSWFHSANTHDGMKQHSTITQYNPLSRNPLYAGGSFCAYTELNILKDHFHPSVSLFATNLLNGETIKYPGDPLKDFTLIRFLDRFVFKNPKKIEQPQGGVHPTFGKRKLYRPRGIKSLCVDSATYLGEQQKNIPVDELFVYNYLQRRGREKHNRMEEDGDSDLESVGSVEFEEMLDKMSGMPKNDEDLDYMNDIGTNLRKKKSNTFEDSEEEELSGDDEDELSEDEDSFDEDVSDEELEADETTENIDDEDKELIDDLDDDELSDIVFESDDESNQKVEKIRKSLKKKQGDLGSLFASAEEFASILEDEGSSGVISGTSNTVSNKDNSSKKQIQWEANRNRWLKGYNKAVGKKEYKKGQQKGFKRKLPHNNNSKKKKRF